MAKNNYYNLHHLLDLAEDRLYIFSYDDNRQKVVCKEGSCLICKHCKDVYYDYTHGPYLTFCEYELEMKTCNKFELMEGLEEYGKN